MCIGNSESFQVDHLDFNRGNNYLTNLKWATALENTSRSFKSGRFNLAVEKRIERLKDLSSSGKHPFQNQTKEQRILNAEKRKKNYKKENTPFYGKTGKNHPTSKAINQYDLNGNFIKT